MLSMLMTTEYTPEDQLQLQQLLLSIAGGEREALAELYQRTKTAVYGLALSYLKNAHDAQDLTQDVCGTKRKKPHSVKKNGTPFPHRRAVWMQMNAFCCCMRWLLSVMRNGALCCSMRSLA